ncbi:hypothetical protein AB0L75_02105 [Streptomyces sp. NPDC052101]|uniref:hypothetical protein n=1 Tax=Streptomyces sp. NPDC052101 TaxID=3155763 RepID=UPI003419971E
MGRLLADRTVRWFIAGQLCAVLGDTMLWLVAGMVLCGASMPWIAVGLTTVGLRHTAPELVGRVYSGFNLMMVLPQMPAMACGAALIAVLDFRVILVVMSAVVTAAACCLFTRKEQRWTAKAPADERMAGEPRHEPDRV